ncbi:hypothetical protein IMZ48_42025, partial [Candidatus Bathyarchaeota archaeon]|nr:hypothetical protein [Candidatus Bathyarchaeota archaeon]
LSMIFSEFQDPSLTPAIPVNSNGKLLGNSNGVPVRAPRDPGNAIAIANARLSCSELRDAADEFLVANLVVSLDQASLNRIDEISRHPTISRGVHSVIVTLDYRPKELAESLDLFVEFRARQMKALLTQIPGPQSARLDGLVAQERAWMNEVNAVEGPESQEDTEERQFIREAHTEFKRQHEEQYRLVHSGSFIRELTASISRMPRFKTLRFETPAKIPVVRALESGEFMSAKFMSAFFTSALQWRDIDNYVGPSLGQLEPLSILSDLPIAIRAAGATLRHYAVAKFPLYQESIAILAPRGEDPANPAWYNLRAAFNNLESVALQDVRGPYEDDPASSEAITILDRFVGAAVSGPRLKTIVVSGEDIKRGFKRSAFYPLGAVLSSIRSQVVHSLVTTRVSIHQHQLETFYAHPDTRPTHSIINRGNMRSGSWEGAAEFLRLQKIADEGERYTVGFTRLGEMDDETDWDFTQPDWALDDIVID